MIGVDIARLILRSIMLVLSILTLVDVLWIIAHRTNGARLWKIPLALLMGINITLAALFIAFSFEHFIENDSLAIVSNAQLLVNSVVIYVVEHYKKLVLKDKDKIL